MLVPLLLTTLYIFVKSALVTGYEAGKFEIAIDWPDKSTVSIYVRVDLRSVCNFKYD